MSDLRQRVASLTPEQRAALSKRLGERTAPVREPIAIVGMSCRLPGADGLDAYWDLLVEGRDAVGPPPPGRRDHLRTEAGYLSAVDGFDAEFFGVPAREARSMDPQQRLLLEVAWEALEHAGIPADRVRGSSAGVFVGIHSHSSDYHLLQLATPGEVDPYGSTGAAHSIVANRLSYWLDLRGPSMAIDTACSSSLVAVHQACLSLRAGETDLALAGGVNLLLLEAATTAFDRLGILSPGARCRVFDAAADGIARGEGVGVVVLKRLSDAERDGDRILAVVRGSGVNQDGASNGLTAPNGAAQVALLKKVWSDSGISGAQLSLVETHGTGTPLGDPIEVAALSDAIGAAGAQASIWLGAVKSQIGHLEAAAGIAALIKAVLCLTRRSVPAVCHFQTLNPQIELVGSGLAVPTRVEALPARGRLLAGVSSFGFGGTNAHLCVESGPERAIESVEPAPVLMLPLSARSGSAVRELGMQLTGRLRSSSDADLRNIVATAALRRTHHDHRLAAVGVDRDSLVADLERRMTDPVRPASRDGIVFAFGGQGTQWSGMGRELRESERVFRATFDAIADRYRSLSGVDLVELIDGRDAGRLAETGYAQPAIFAVQAGLVALLRSWGIVPDRVVGHSVGEIAAAHAAGILSLEAAVDVVYHRARLMQSVPRGGAMIQIGLAETELRAVLDGFGPEVAVAALNAPAVSVAAGPREVVDALASRLQADGVSVQRVPVEYAFHSPAVAPVTEPLVQALRGVVPGAGSIPIVSTVTGLPARAGDFTPEYWARNVRETVRFAPAIRRSLEDGAGIVLEISPHPALLAGVAAVADQLGRPVATVAVMRRDRPVALALRQAVAALYAAGVDPDWSALVAAGAPVDLPRYPWQRTRHWLGAPDVRALGNNVLGTGSTVPGVTYRVEWQASAAQVGLPSSGEPVAVPSISMPPTEDEGALLASLERRSGVLIAEAFARLGVLDLADPISWDTAMGLGVLPRYRRLWERSCRILADDGVLAESGRGSWRVVGKPSGQSAVVAGVEGALLEQCAAPLADVLVGRADPLALLFPEGGTVSAAAIYTSTASARRLNEAVAAAVRQIVTNRGGAPVRIVEVGAGTGATTAHVLPILPSGSRYLATDVSPTLLEGLAQRFGAVEGASFHRLDAERSPRAQGLPTQCADLVIASNVLHATRNLNETLAHVRSLLAPGGLLILIETTAPRRWIDLTFGLTEGWWRYDDRRTDSALLDPAGWAAELEQSGFESAAALGHDAGAVHAQALIMARRDRSPQRMGPIWTLTAADGTPAEWHDRLDRFVSVDPVDSSAGTTDWSAEVAKAVARHGERWAGIVYDASRLPDTPTAAVQAAHQIARITTALRAKTGSAARLVVVTNGSIATSGAESSHAAQATLWGMGRSIALEASSIWGGLIDLDPSHDAARQAGTVAAGLLDPDEEDQVVWRAGSRLVPRLVPDRDPAPVALSLRADASYLVTGAFGGLGPKLIRWLARSGARHLILIGRSAPLPSDWSSVAPDSASGKAITEIRAAEADGVQCTVVAADVGNHDAMARIFDEARGRGYPVRGVVHAAASIRFAGLEELTEACLEEALHAKSSGALVLDALTRDGLNDFLVFFSSGTTILGASKLAAYAAANQFLAAVAQERVRAGYPATVVDWGAWDEIRLLGSDGTESMAALGFEVLDDARALATLAGLIGENSPPRFVAALDIGRLREAYQVHRRRPMLDGLPAATTSAAEEITPAATPASSPSASLTALIAGCTPSRALARLTDFVVGSVAHVLGVAPDTVDPSRGLFDLGLDSLMAVGLRNRLEAAGAGSLPATLVFNYPTAAAIAELLNTRLGASVASGDDVVAVEPASAVAAEADEDVRAQLLAELKSIDLGVET